MYGFLAVIAAGIIYIFYWANKRFTEVEKVLDSHSEFLVKMYENRPPSENRPPPEKRSRAPPPPPEPKEKPVETAEDFPDDESVMTEKTFVGKENF